MNLKAQNKTQVFQEMTDFMGGLGLGLDTQEVLKGLWDREERMTTGIARHIALPHTAVRGLERSLGFLALSPEGLDYGSLDGKPVRLVMMLLGSEDDPSGHLLILRNLALLITNPQFIPRILECRRTQEVWETLVEFEHRATELYS